MPFTEGLLSECQQEYAEYKKQTSANAKQRCRQKLGRVEQSAVRHDPTHPSKLAELLNAFRENEALLEAKRGQQLAEQQDEACGMQDGQHQLEHEERGATDEVTVVDKANQPEREPPIEWRARRYLPIHILHSIFAFLDYRVLVRTHTVCKVWHAAGLYPNLWRNLCREAMLCAPGSYSADWRALFVRGIQNSDLGVMGQLDAIAARAGGMSSAEVTRCCDEVYQSSITNLRYQATKISQDMKAVVGRREALHHRLQSHTKSMQSTAGELVQLRHQLSSLKTHRHQLDTLARFESRVLSWCFHPRPPPVDSFCMMEAMLTRADSKAMERWLVFSNCPALDELYNLRELLEGGTQALSDTSDMGKLLLHHDCIKDTEEMVTAVLELRPPQAPHCML